MAIFTYFRFPVGKVLLSLSLISVGLVLAACGAASGGASTSVSASQTPHTVELRWSGNASAAGYIVYRRVQPDVVFLPLNSNPITDTAFSDANVKSGQQVAYCVTAVAADGTQSEPSAEVLAFIP